MMDEATRIHVPFVPIRPSMTVADLQLASYVCSARSQGRYIDTDTIHSLHAATSVMAAVRSAIPRRGNVRSDHVATDGRSTYELIALRRAAREESLNAESAINCALSLESGVGACAEMSRVTQLYLGERLLQNEQASRVILKPDIDNHALVVLHANKTLLVAADAWAKGPAVLPRDSRYARRVEDFDDDLVIMIDRESGAAQLKELRQTKNDFANNRSMQSALARERRYLAIEREQLQSGTALESLDPISAMQIELLRRHESNLYSNTSVLNRAFIRRLPDARRQPALSRRIARAGAMREFGASVRDAVWFANRNGGVERALLHPDFPDDRLLTPAREDERTLGEIRTPRGRLLDFWSA